MGETGEWPDSLEILLGGQRPVSRGRARHERGQQGTADHRAFDGQPESVFLIVQDVGPSSRIKLVQQGGSRGGERDSRALA